MAPVLVRREGTRLVLGYLALIGLSALAGVAWQLRDLLG